MEAAEIGVDTAGDAYLPQSGNGGYRTVSISLSLRYRIARNRLDGTAELLLRANQRLARFSLDLVGLSASGVRVDGRRADVRQVQGKLRITPQRPIETGTEFLVVVEYGGAPKPRRTRSWGAIGWEELDDGVLVASQPSGAPTCSRATTTRSTRRAIASASRRMPPTPSWPTASSRTTGSSAGRACGSTTSASPRRATS